MIKHLIIITTTVVTADKITEHILVHTSFQHMTHHSDMYNSFRKNF